MLIQSRPDPLPGSASPHYTPKRTAPYRGISLPSLTEALTLLENTALWPPPIRRAAVGLWCTESGMHPGEVWDVAARLLEVAL